MKTTLSIAISSLLCATACSSSGSSSTQDATATDTLAGDTHSSTTTAQDSAATSSDTGSTTNADSATTASDTGSTTNADSATTASDTGSTTNADSATTPTDSGVADSTTDTSSHSATGQWVMGYWAGWESTDLPIANIDWSGLTHIALSFLTVNSDNSLNETFGGSTTTGPQIAQQLSTAAHANGVKAILSLGGSGSGANIATAASPANRAAFVAALVSAVQTLGYDGIDLDWEDSVDADNLLALAQALRTAKPSMIITYPAGVINRNVNPTVGAQYVTLAASVDQYNVMSYGSSIMSGSGWDSWFMSAISGSAGAYPVAIDDTFNRYVAAGIPKAKLGMGIGFWAYCYTGGVTGPRQATTSGAQYISDDGTYPLSLFYAAGSSFANSTVAEQMRDSTAQEPYLSFTTAIHDTPCNADVGFIGYEDETSIIAKGSFSKTNGYGGIIIWTLNGGLLPANAVGGRAPNALTQALKQGFLQ